MRKTDDRLTRPHRHPRRRLHERRRPAPRRRLRRPRPRRRPSCLDRPVRRPVGDAGRVRHGQSLTLVTAGQADDRHGQPGLPAVLRRERGRHKTAPWELGDPTNGEGFESAVALRDRGAARVRQGPRSPGSSSRSPTRSRPGPRPSTSTSTRSRYKRRARRRPRTCRRATTSATRRSSSLKTTRSPR